MAAPVKANNFLSGVTQPASVPPVVKLVAPQTLSVATDGKPVNLPGVPHPVPQYAVLPPEMKSDTPLNFEQNVLRAQIKQGLATKTIDETEAVKRLNALIQKQALAQYGVTGSWLNKLVAGASTTAEYAIPGLIVAAKDPAAAGKAVYGSFKETVTDPVGQFKNDPFSFFTNAFALASGGAGAAARVGAVGRTVAGAAARDLPTALGALSKADKRAFAAVHKANGPVDSFGFNLDVADVPTVNRILKPSVKLQDVISKDPEFAKLHSQTVDLIQKGQIGTGVVNRGAAVRAVGASLPAQVLKSAIKTPVPKQRTLSVGGMVVNPPSYRNTLTNEALRLYDKAVTQRRLDRVYGTPGSTPGSIIPESVGNVWGPAAKVGRESAEAQKILNQVANAAGERLAFYGPSVPARVAGKAGSKAVMSRGTLLPRQTMRLSAIEQKVIDIVGGTGASFDEHIQSHTNDVQRWKDEAAQIQTDLSSGIGDAVKLGKRLKLVEKYATSSMDQAILSAAAKKIYENPRPVLARAIEGVRVAATKAEQAKIDLPGDISLSTESAAFRIGARTAEIKASAAGLPSPIKAIEDLKKSNPDQANALRQGIVDLGNKLISDGVFYIPQKEKAASGFKNVKVTKGKYGISVRPTGKAFENKGYTGELQRRGTFRTDVTQLTREQYKQVTRWVNIKRGLDTFLQSPDIDPTSKYAVAVRTDAPIPDDLKNAIDNIHRGNITRKEEKLLDEKVVEYLKSILPSRGSVFPGEPGIRYVDSRFGKSVLSQMNVPGSAPIRDTLNGIARGGLLYTKPAYYIANAMQTLGTNVGRQGVFAPVNWTSALRLASKLGEDDAAKILNLTHEGFFSTFDPGRGPLAGALGAASHFGNTLTDRIPRIAAWLHEARAEGFNTTETIHELLSNPKYNDKLIDISRRANNESVPYGDLTPFEQNQIKRTIFFYPWIRASAVYTMRFPFEHPFQTAAYNALAQEAQNEITNLFDGKIPAYLEGLVHVGGGKFILPKNVNNFNSLGEMVKAVDGLMPGGNPEYALNLASSLVPSLQFGISALTGRSSFGYKYPDGTSGLSGAIQDQWRSQPLVVLFGRVFGKQVDPTDPTNSPIVPRDPMTTGGRYVLGPSLFPTKVNQAGIISRAEKTKLDSMHGEKKISYSYDLQNAELDLWNEKRLQTGTGLSNAALDSIKRGLGLQRQRDIEFLKVNGKDAPVDRARQRFNLMLKVFVDNGIATQQQVDVVSQQAASATLDQVEKAASSFWSAVPDIRSLSLYTSAVNAEAGMAK